MENRIPSEEGLFMNITNQYCLMHFKLESLLVVLMICLSVLHDQFNIHKNNK